MGSAQENMRNFCGPAGNSYRKASLKRDSDSPAVQSNTSLIATLISKATDKLRQCRLTRGAVLLAQSLQCSSAADKSL
jgi:hypothetical protein